MLKNMFFSPFQGFFARFSPIKLAGTKRKT